MDQYYQDNGRNDGLNCQCSPYADCQQEEEPDEIDCECSPEAYCQQGQNYELNCECAPEADCQQPPEATCACSKNAMCKKSIDERQLIELAEMGLLRPEIEEFDPDPLLEEPYSNLDLTNSKVLIVDVPGEGEEAGAGANNDVVLYDPEDLFLFVSPQSHNLSTQRQRLLDAYIEDLSISEVEEAAVALRLLVNLFRQRRKDMNKLVPLLSIGSKSADSGCGCK